MKKIIDQLSELGNKRNEAQYAWNRQMLTISAGGFAILIGLSPKVPDDRIGKVLLAAAWAFLGLGILSGAAATYAEASLARSLLKNFREQVERNMEKNIDPSMNASRYTGGQAGLLPRLGMLVMMWSLSFAVVSFVSCSIRQILTN